jgi:hexokinase
MPVTTAEILAMRDALAAEDPTLTPAKVVQGVRTLVHARLQIDKPFPCPLPPPDKGRTREDYDNAYKAAATDEERQQIHDDEMMHYVARRAAMQASVPVSAHHAYQKAAKPPGIRDAHHYMQFLHGKALWEEADKLVADAGVK